MRIFQAGSAGIQSDLFYDYRSNVASYRARQSWVSRHHPPTLVLWGRDDPSFAVAGAAAWQQDVSSASVQILDAGHFALDEQVDTIAALIRDFLASLPACQPASLQPSRGSLHG